MHDESPNIVRLAVHLPDEQLLYYQEGEMPNTVLDRGATTLTEWFKTNQEDETARGYFYHQFPSHYVWVKKRWQHRKCFTKGRPIGRLYLTHPGIKTIIFLL